MKELTICIVILLISCNYSDGSYVTLHFSKNQTVQIQGVSPILDTLHMTSYKDAIYLDDHSVIKIYSHHFEEWSLEYLRTRHCKEGGNKIVSQIECLSEKIIQVDGIDVVEKDFFLPRERVYLKSWIWDIGACQYYLGVEKFGIVSKQIDSLQRVLSINRFELIDQDSYNCRDINMIPIPVRFFEEDYFYQ